MWFPYPELNHPALQLDRFKWKLFAQEDLTITSHETKNIMLQFGVEMTMGVVLVSLSQQLIRKKCSLQNGSVLENTDNICVSIYNNSNESVSINAGDLLCLLAFIASV